MQEHRALHLNSRLPLIWLSAAFLAALLLPDGVWTTLLVGFGGLFLVAYAWAREMQRNLHGRRRLRYSWVSVGDRLMEEFTLANDSFLPAFWVQIVDESNVPGYRAGVVRSVGINAVDRWRQEAICRRRGQYHLGPWELHSADPFGIFTVTVRYPQSEELIIHPPIHTELPIPLPAGKSSGRSRSRERSPQATVNAATVRDYHPQDPLRWIHWPTTARQGRLLVRQFDLEAAGDVWILPDMQAEVQLGEGSEGTEEHAVLLAAALVGRALHENRAIGLASYGRVPRIIPPGRGEGQEWRLLRALALATADGETELGPALQDLSRVARRGSAAVIITPGGRAGWLPSLVTLSQAGVQCNVILLDRDSFGGTGNGKGLRDAIRRLGFNCHVVRRGDVGQPPAPGEGHGYWEFKTLATGKVIVVSRPE